MILALPAPAAAKLLPELPLSKYLEQIRYVSVANIALAYNEEDIAFPLNGSGFVVPHKEGRMITACTWTSSKWTHAAPKGSVLLRTYIGRSHSEEWMQRSDQELLSSVRRDLQDIMGITAEPTFSKVTRCYHSMPQYPIGHSEKIKSVKEQLSSQRPGLFLCGAGYEGVGIPDCIQQGKTAAEQMMKFIVGNSL